MEKKYITEEEFSERMASVDEKLIKGKYEASCMTYDEQLEAYTKFIKLYGVKKMPKAGK